MDNLMKNTIVPAQQIAEELALHKNAKSIHLPSMPIS